MIVITAPSGAIGHQVLAGLLKGGEQVRVIARDPFRLPAHTRERVEVVPGSHSDADVVARAFAGADTVFWLVPVNPCATSLDAAFLEFTRPACEAFARHGIERVVGISALGRGFGTQAGLATASLAMDDLIASTGVAYRALTMPAFMENMFMHARSIMDEGVFRSPIAADLKLPTVATRDIATVAVRLLLDRGWAGHSSVPVLRPADLSFADIAGTLSAVLGRTVQYQQVSAERTTRRCSPPACRRRWPRACSTCCWPRTRVWTSWNGARSSRPRRPLSGHGAKKCSGPRSGGPTVQHRYRAALDPLHSFGSFPRANSAVHLSEEP
jgi:uncharacterized protein YbjT (DUF2867 family)